ncbi:MAG: glycosyltransferase [Calditrichaeota bacterium]|nr:glycosyltransferase [Calditrichota bacterium]
MVDILFVFIVLLVAHYSYLMISINWGIVNLYRKRQAGEKQVRVSFSIIIAARNEEKFIGQLLDSISRLDYPPELYEVIIINDRSSDRTSEIIESYKTSVNRLQHLHQNEISSGLSPKKSALMKGIRAAVNEVIVTTDADCIVPSKWLETMSSYYSEKTDVVAGPVRFVDYPIFRLFMNLQSLDFLSLVSMAAGAISLKKAVICSGANFSYRKSAFEKVGGYGGHLFIASGDDDLLLQNFAKNQLEINYAWSTDAVVLTHPVEKFKGFIEQRKRWGSKAAKYKGSSWTKHFYMIFLFYICLFSLLIASFFSINYAEFFLGILVIKAIFELPIVFKVTRLVGRPFLILFYPLLQLFQVPYLVISGLLANLGTYNWK